VTNEKFGGHVILLCDLSSRLKRSVRMWIGGT